MSPAVIPDMKLVFSYRFRAFMKAYQGIGDIDSLPKDPWTAKEDFWFSKRDRSATDTAGPSIVGQLENMFL